jgi:UDP-N-acetylmuramoylalanine--D-glutamate ligase
MKIPEKIKSAKKTHVMGITGQEGRAVFDYLLSSGLDIRGHVSAQEQGFIENFLSFSDAYEESEARAMAERFLVSGKLVFGDDYGKGINAGDAVIMPQACRRYSSNEPIIEMSKRGEIFLIQAIEFAFSIIDCKTIGVTGTAGKSTVTALIRDMLQESGSRFCFSGNDRENKWDFFAFDKLPEDGIALFEISHRHLMDLKQSPNIAVITNIFPHHLDDAGSYENYIEIKKNIFRYQNAGDFAIINQSLMEEGIIKESGEIASEVITYGGGRIEANFKNRSVKIDPSDFKLYGEHNIQNANGAMLAGLVAGLSVPAIETAIKNFRGLKYREELVGEYEGVKIINDGKSTDPVATIEAVKSIPKIGILILGGVREGVAEGDFLALGKAILERKVKKVFVFGKSADDLINDLSSAGAVAEKCDSLENAVQKSRKTAERGEAIVFSPACQSFDGFKDYRERALAFNEAISEIFG